MAKVAPEELEEFKRMTTVLPTEKKSFLRDLQSQGKSIKSLTNIAQDEKKVDALMATLRNNIFDDSKKNSERQLERMILNARNFGKKVSDPITASQNLGLTPEELRLFLLSRYDEEKFGTPAFSQLKQDDIERLKRLPKEHRFFVENPMLREYINSPRPTDEELGNVSCMGGKCVILRRGGYAPLSRKFIK